MTRPEPKDCTFTHNLMRGGNEKYQCVAEWVNPEKPIPAWRAVAVWYGPRDSLKQMEEQAYLALLDYIQRVEIYKGGKQ